MFDFVEIVLNLVFFGIFVWLMYYLFIVVPRRTKHAFTVFANKYHFVYHPTVQPPYTGLLLGRASNLVVGVRSHGMPITIFHLFHVVGSGKNRREYRRTVAAISIKNTHLHAYVNAKLNNLTEQISITKNHHYSAEGNFGKYFDMYFPGSKRVRSLSIFAPDVMSLIMADYGFNDIEIVNDVVYLYDFKFIDKANELEKFYLRAIKLADAIDNNTPHSIKFKTVAEALESHRAVLKRKDHETLKTLAGILLGLIFIFNFLTISFGPQEIPGGQIMIYALPAVVVLFILYGLRTAVVHGRLKRDYLEDRKDFQKDHKSVEPE